MAEKNDSGSIPSKPEEAKPAKGGKKTMILVVAMLAIEAVVIIGAMKMLGGPQPVHAESVVPEQGEETEEEKSVEVLVLDDKLPNSRQGVNYLYKTEIYVQVKRKHEPMVTDILTRYRMELRAELIALWRTSDPKEIQEPRMENLTRKVEALLAERFGHDKESDDPIILKCVIVSGPGFRVDG
jgi:hypothetical protein